MGHILIVYKLVFKLSFWANHMYILRHIGLDKYVSNKFKQWKINLQWTWPLLYVYGSKYYFIVIANADNI